MAMQGGFMGRMTSEREKSYRLRDIDKSILRMFLGYLKPRLGTLVVVMLVMAVVAGANMVAPLLSKVAIDRYIVPGNATGLHYVLVAFIALYALFWLSSYRGSYLSIRLGQRIVADVRRDLFRHVSSQSMDFFSKTQTGEIMSRLTNDVNTLADFVSSGIINLVSDILSLAGIVVMMYLLNVKLASIVLITIPIIFAGTVLIGKHMRKAYGKVREKVGKLNAGVEENLSGIRVVKSMNQETGNMSAFEQLNKENLFAQIKAVIVSALVFPFMSLTGTLGTVLVVLAGGIMVVNGEPGATVGLLIAFMGYTNRFFMPLRDLSQVYGVYQGAAASAERIREYLDLQTAIATPTRPTDLPDPVRGGIGFEHVTFAYEADRPVIKNLCVEIPPRQVTAVVGPTGAGKSTMIRLLARLYDTQEGAVRIDGVDVRQIEPSALREAVMLVPQDVFLFTGTIMENLRYGRLDATDEEVLRVSVDACTDEFIRALPNGYDTQVGESGMMLSGGQRQLIAFARAILADRPILILDEATSSVDAGTEVLIQRALDHLLKDRTSIIVAHRFTTLRRADKTLVLDNGELAGYDTHANLLDTCDVYKNLYEKQWIG